MPQTEPASLVTQVCLWIESSPTLPELAQRLGVSASHLKRIFKSLSPAAYARALQAQRVHHPLQKDSCSVADTMYAAGLASSGRFYETAPAVLGMSPTHYRRGGAQQTLRFGVRQCSLGAILVAQSERGVCAIFLGDDPADLIIELQDRFANAELSGADSTFEQYMALVVGLVENPSLCVDVPLDIQGTAFQQRVWQALRQIPCGQTLSYSELAQRIGSPQATRAVASACAANMLAVAIPCHRVVRQDGSLSGYRWGVERKEALLQHETLCNPKKPQKSLHQ